MTIYLFNMSHIKSGELFDQWQRNISEPIWSARLHFYLNPNLTVDQKNEMKKMWQNVSPDMLNTSIQPFDFELLRDKIGQKLSPKQNKKYRSMVLEFQENVDSENNLDKDPLYFVIDKARNWINHYHLDVENIPGLKEWFISLLSDPQPITFSDLSLHRRYNIDCFDLFELTLSEYITMKKNHPKKEFAADILARWGYPIWRVHLSNGSHTLTVYDQLLTFYCEGFNDNPSMNVMPRQWNIDQHIQNYIAHLSIPENNQLKESFQNSIAGSLFRLSNLLENTLQDGHYLAQLKETRLINHQENKKIEDELYAHIDNLFLIYSQSKNQHLLIKTLQQWKEKHFYEHSHEHHIFYDYIEQKINQIEQKNLVQHIQDVINEKSETVCHKRKM